MLSLDPSLVVAEARTSLFVSGTSPCLLLWPSSLKFSDLYHQPSFLLLLVTSSLLASCSASPLNTRLFIPSQPSFWEGLSCFSSAAPSSVAADWFCLRLRWGWARVGSWDSDVADTWHLRLRTASPTSLPCWLTGILSSVYLNLQSFYFAVKWIPPSVLSPLLVSHTSWKPQSPLRWPHCPRVTHFFCQEMEHGPNPVVKATHLCLLSNLWKSEKPNCCLWEKLGRQRPSCLLTMMSFSGRFKVVIGNQLLNKCAVLLESLPGSFPGQWLPLLSGPGCHCACGSLSSLVYASNQLQSGKLVLPWNEYKDKSVMNEFSPKD